MDDKLDSSRCARLLKAMADADRLRIVQFLRSGSHHVSEVAEALELDIAKTSHHLGVLRNAGFVHSEREGRFVHYSLNPQFFIAADENNEPTRIELGCCRIELP